MRKEELFKLCGSLEQLATARPVEFRDGKADGLKGILVQNGPLETLLMESKCLDPAWLRYKGINLSYLSKPGLQGKSPLETDPIQSGRSMMIGGMMTCGLENIHGGLTVNGSFYPAHGRIRSTAAEKVCADAAFTEEGYTLTARTPGNRLVRLTDGDESLVGTYQDIELTGSNTWSFFGKLN